MASEKEKQLGRQPFMTLPLSLSIVSSAQGCLMSQWSVSPCISLMIETTEEEKKRRKEEEEENGMSRQEPISSVISYIAHMEIHSLYQEAGGAGVLEWSCHASGDMHAFSHTHLHRRHAFGMTHTHMLQFLPHLTMPVDIFQRETGWSNFPGCPSLHGLGDP